MFGLKLDMNELKNQHVHLFWGVMSNFIFLKLFGFKFLGIGAIVGILVECYQYFFKKEGLKLADRILDVSFWAMSGPIFFILRG